MRLQATKSTVENSNQINDNAKEWARKNWDYLTQTDTPLNQRQQLHQDRKRAKNQRQYTGILYLKPADQVTTKTICAAADLMGCKKGCLIDSGQLGKKAGSNAATKRTILLALEPETFKKHLRIEILKHQLDYGDTLAIRLNGTSDIDFSDLIASMPDQLFYDYTKIYSRVVKNDLANYDLTFSGSANNAKSLQITARAIKAGKRTVLAVNTAETKGEYKLPKKLGLIPVVNFDDTDARFKDRKNAIGVLKRKGSNRAQRAQDETKSGFFFNQSTLGNLAALI